MSLYKYPNWHEIKDLAMIYREAEWDNARVVVWDPERQQKFRLVFCGSSKTDGDEPNKINFVIYPEKEEEKNKEE